MSLNNNPEDNNQSFGSEFSEDMENFDNDPAVVAATEGISSKSKGGWLILLVGILGTGAYLGYRYYLVPHGTTLASIEATLLAEKKALMSGSAKTDLSTPAHATAAVDSNNGMKTAKAEVAPAPSHQGDTDKATRQASKNAQFEHLKNYLFDNSVETKKTKTAVAVPPPTPTPTVKAETTVAAKTATTPTVVSQKQPETPSTMGNAIQQVTQLNERLEANINQIQHLEDALQGITQTIAKLNSDINAMDNRLLALSNSTGHLSNDMGAMKHEMSSVKRALGEEAMLDIQVPPAPSHNYLKASQAANMRPKAAVPAYLVHAIIPGRAWLKANNGQILTVTEGDTLGDYGKVLVIDAASGMVLTSSGNTFQ